MALGGDALRLLDRRSPSVEDSASSEDGSRAHLFRERLALREQPLPDGPAPSSWVCVPKSPDFQPRLASPDVGFYSLFTKLRCDGSSSSGRRSAEGVLLLEGRSRVDVF